MSGSKDQRAVSGQDVQQIAELARLRPDQEAVRQLTEELNGILEHVRLLETLDVSEIDEEDSITLDPVLYRDPKITPDELRGNAPGSIAPDWRDGFFVVPRLPALDQGGSPGDVVE